MNSDIVAFIPAHNEAENITDAVLSAKAQVDKVFVIADNCTDDTTTRATAAGATIIPTLNNAARKAGALNQGLRHIPEDTRYVLVMDADTRLSENFVNVAEQALKNPEVGAAGAIFYGEHPKGFLEHLQAWEWVRYAEQINRTKKTFILSGTAALIKKEALDSVNEKYGRIYDPNSITEDMRLTMDLKGCGWKLVSPAQCTVNTELMPNIKLLFYQRRRWSLGALQNIFSYGFNKVSAIYWRQQIMLNISISLMVLYLVLSTLSVLDKTITFQPLWMVVGLIFVAERVVTVWDVGWKARLVAATVIPELLYAFILQFAHISAIWQFVRKNNGTWNHVGG